jgi:flagellar hook-associated protein 2
MLDSIQLTGLASGIDSKTLIERLLRIERAPIQRLEAKQAAAQRKIDLFATLSRLVDDLRDRADGLGTRSKFLSFAVSASEEGYATVSANGSASEGTHTLRVDALATADRWAFDAVADPDLDLASADGETVSFDYDGVSYSVRFDVATSSLREIASAIETATGGAVQTSVVDEGTASSPSWRLVMTAGETGADHRIANVASGVAGLSIAWVAPDASGNAQSANNLTVGANARAVIDGLAVERSSNDFDDVIDGVSIALLRADPARTLTFTVGADAEAIQGRIQGFVDAYNAVIDFVRAEQRYSTHGGPSGPLFGDSALRSVERTLRGALFGSTAAQVAADGSGFGTLRLLGIETGSDGKLSIDETRLSAKLAEDLEQFADLFVDTDGFDNGGAAPGTAAYYVDQTADTGLGDDLARAIGRLVDAYDDGAGNYYAGLFDARTDALEAESKAYDARIARMEDDLVRLEESLTRRFAALEALMSQLQAQGAYLQASAR